MVGCRSRLCTAEVVIYPLFWLCFLIGAITVVTTLPTCFAHQPGLARTGADMALVLLAPEDEGGAVGLYQCETNGPEPLAA